ncbi:MAG: DUF1631 domain-containing protein [Xanthomonadales bacterium]|nr:DUF1631 domain-containing protein [Xanthomonadales bacterium]
MIKKNSQEKDSAENTKLHAATDVLMPQILAKFDESIKSHLTVFFENTDDTLFNLAEKADSNQVQTLYFEAMRTVRVNRKNIKNSFMQLLQNAFNATQNKKFDSFFDDSSKYDRNTRTINLQLVDETELDEVLAKTNLVHKSEVAYHRHIFAFEQRFSRILDIQVNKDQIPIAPFTLVHIFALSLNEIPEEQLDIKIKLILYKVFERTVMGQLNDVYSKINQFLEEKNIVKDIKYNISNNNNRSKSKKFDNERAVKSENDSQVPIEPQLNTACSVSVSGVEQSTTNQSSTTDENYLLISQLFQQNRVVIDPNLINSINSSMVHVDLENIILALTSLQNEIASHQDFDSESKLRPEQIKQNLLSKLHTLNSETKTQRVMSYDEETIDLIGMMFQFMVEDRDIPAKIQVLLVKLQIPYLKIALQDRKLFADKNHYARVILDKLSKESASWSEDSDKNNHFFENLKQTVIKILKLTRYTAENFKIIQDDFEEFVSKIKKKAQIAQKRTQEKEMGREKIKLAKIQVAELLSEKMTNKQIPILIRDVLLNEWANVLLLIRLRHKEDSEEYRRKLKFVDDLINFSQDKIYCSDEKLSEISELYAQGLKLVAFSHSDILEKLDMLNNCLQKMLKETIEESIDVSTEDQAVFPETQESVQQSKEDEEEEFENIDDEFSKLVPKLKIGTWFEFTRPEQSPVRAKLSWISPLSGKYLFVNSRGLKITDKTSPALAAGLRNKTIRTINRTAIFDRALSAIADKIKKTISH